MGDFNNNNVCQYAERLFFSAGNNSICHGLKPYSIFVKILFKIYVFCTFHGFVLDISVAKSGNKLLSNIWLGILSCIYIWVWESYFLHFFKHYCNSMNYPNFSNWMTLNSASLSLSKNSRYARSCYSCFASISWVIWLIDYIQICTILHYLLQFNI